jgi:ABC-2 type transport system permease protein
VKAPKTFFSFRMYRESLAQLALPGFLFAALLFSGTMLMAWGTLLFDGARFAEITNAWFLMPVYVWTAPFLFSLLAFGFLDSRRTSDFYHALPIKREALFLSKAAAVYTWLLATALFVMIAGAGTFIAAGVTGSVYLAAFVALDMITGMLFAATLMMLAMTLSGTVFTNIVLANIFLWLPLLVSSLFRSGVLSAVPVLPRDAVTFFGLDLHITLFGSFRFFDDLIIPTAANSAWTVFVSLILLALAAFFFVRRKSEAAGSSAPSNFVQALLRIAVALPPLLIVFATINVGRLLTASGLFAVVAALVISLCLMGAFELISTKKWKSLIRVPLSFAIALGLSLLFSFSIWAVSAYEANFTPSADEIAWVRVSSPNVSDPWSRYRSPLRNSSSWDGRDEIVYLIDERLRIEDGRVHAEVTRQLESGKTAFDRRNALDSRPGGGFGMAFEDALYDTFFPYDSWMWSENEELIVEVRTVRGATRTRVLAYGERNWHSDGGSGVRLNNFGIALVGSAQR